MKDIFFYAFKESPSRTKILIGLIALVFSAGCWWARLFYTLSDHEKRLIEIESVMKELPVLMRDVKDALLTHKNK